MKKLYRFFLFGGFSALMALGSASCTDYLDKEADSTVNPDDAFKSFMNFQGFVEEIYNCIPDKEKCNYTTSWNWGDDEIMNPEADGHMCHQVDIGNFRAWYTCDQTWLYRNETDPRATYHPNDDGTAKFKHALWPHSWYCIRKCNYGLENLDKLTEATGEQRDLIEGQLYFFRAWWHFELMQFWGGLPYIDKVLSPSDEMTLPRLSFQECAEKAAADFRKAADLLPIDWDKTSTGASTIEHNDLRVNKIMALGYLGKTYLWAGSPLMEHGAQTNAGDLTYQYNTEYCKAAANAFGELLSLVESGQTQYELVDFEDYHTLFYTTGEGWRMPGAEEAIFRGPSEDFNGSNWNTTKTFGPKINALVEHDNVIHQPTANYVNFYGMENGLPISEGNDPTVKDNNSGYDPSYPFKGRDARFYNDIVFDGYKYVQAAISDPNDEALRYCSLHEGGQMRSETNASRTGYFTQKLVPTGANKYDRLYDWSHALHTNLSYMRLADIYLMYAEACAAVGGAKQTADNYTLTAEQAINKLRTRAGVGPVGGGTVGSTGSIDMNYINNNRKFMDEVRRERAVELAFEGFRFNDLQRWLLLTEYPYNVKMSHEFQRASSDEGGFTVEGSQAAEQADASLQPYEYAMNCKVTNFRQEEILERKFDAKHYWFPFMDDDVYLYAEFPQNPGW